MAQAEGVLDLSGTKQWFNWLIILSGVGVVVTLAYFLDAFFTGLINWAMYLVIGSLGIGLIVRSYRDAQFIQNQSDLASQQIKLLEEVDNFDDFLTRSHPSLFRTHIENLYTISLTHSDISQDNLIELLHSRLSARNRVIELFSSILITLGLVGTILGLMLMMDGMTSIMQSGVQSAGFVNELMGPSGPLSGLGVAFVTTLLGAILGGVVLRVLTGVVESNIMEYVAHIAELTEVHVLPFLRSSAVRTD